MADITMCCNSLCPIVKKCYRAQAYKSLWQGWSSFEYTVGVNGIECDYFLKIYETKQTATTDSKKPIAPLG